MQRSLQRRIGQYMMKSEGLEKIRVKPSIKEIDAMKTMSEEYIQQCANKLRALNQTMKEAYSKDPHGDAHRHACAAFHEQYDQYAFPGGLEHALTQLKNKNKNMVPIALAFLSADPYFHRSGYIKEEILHHLKKIDFTHQEKHLLYGLVERSIQHDQARVFRAYAKLFSCVSTPAQQAQIEGLLIDADSKVAQRLKYICHLLRSS